MPSPRRQPTEEYDLSAIQPPVKLGVNGAEQVARCLAGGSEEIKHLLRQECRIIFECCVCASLFRSLANFLAHKRVYCKEDHMLPSSDLASHVSILRQYIQTKAAAMATLAEGANNQSKPTGSSADTPPEEFVGNTHTASPVLQNGMKTDETKTEVANHGETPKKKKPKLVNSPSVDTAQGSNHETLKPTEKTPSATKKKRLCDSMPNNIKKSHVKRKLMDGMVTEGLNGDVNVPLNLDTAACADSSKKNKNTKIKTTPVSIKPMECSVNMGPKNAVAVPTAQPSVSAAVPAVKAPLRSVKGPKKEMAPHLLYPCLYCENVFPGTRMAIDHITAVHKTRKAINVSRIRTKIRKKAFVVKSGKKMRRFQKKSKTLEKVKEKEESSEQKEVKEDLSKSPIFDCKVGKRGHVAHQCTHCSKAYLYKSALERHQGNCTSKQKLDSSNEEGEDAAGRVEGEAAEVDTGESPSPKHSKSSASVTPLGSSKSAAKKVLNMKATTANQNYRVLGEIVFSSCSSAKTDPQSPLKNLLPGSSPDGDASTSTTSSNDKGSPIVIPAMSAYPCPYCMTKARKTFDLLFTHISTKHKDLRPSRRRVVRFLTNSGYKCAFCKSTPRFFKNRVLLRRHREKVHGIMYTTSSPVKANGTKS